MTWSAVSKSVRIAGALVLAIGVAAGPSWAAPKPAPAAATSAAAQGEAGDGPVAAPTEAELRQLRFATPELLEAPIDPDIYVLGPQDLLAILIMIGEQRSERLPVLPEGVVLVPNIGSVPAAGRTLSEFRTALRAAFAKRYRDFELYCYLARPREFRVYVTGEVQRPGMVAARAYERVSDVIDRAGGFTAAASRREVELRDASGAVQARVDLAAFQSRGDLAANPHLSGGQVVWVPVRTHEVDVQGEVNLPAVYEARRGDRLADLLALAGGPTPQADLSQVSVESIDSTGAVQVRTWDLRRDTPPVGDVVRVAVRSAMVGKSRVFVILPSGQEHTLFLAPDETLRDLIGRVTELQPEADLAEAQLSTSGPDGERVQVPVDVAGVLRGDSDHPLRDGDVLSVPRVKSYVYVSGFVTRPGRYVYRGDWTVNDYIGEAGGPTGGGSLGGVKLLGPDGEKRSGERSSRVQRGETVYVDRSFTGKASSFLGLFTNVTALVISLVALRR
jgi:protein involved in polysaccharide export with SLBB domain